MRLLTRRLHLRPVTPGDADALLALDRDPEVMRFVSGGVPTSRATIENWVIPRAQHQFREYGAGMWVMLTRRDGAFAGWTSLRMPRHSGAAAPAGPAAGHGPGTRAGGRAGRITRGGTELELSYRLRREAWGTGLAYEAASALIAAVFGAPDCPVERVFASAHPGHSASLRVMAKLGMRLTADSPALRPGSGWPAEPARDLEYELLRDHWRRSRAPGRPDAGESSPLGSTGMPA